jgi:pyruvate,water dikinase
MMQPTTGLPALDEVLQGVRPGDNVVWKVDSVEDYAALAEPFWKAALHRGEKLVYFRYAQHRELVPPDSGATFIRLRPEAGFERFITRIHEVIASTDRGANFVFDMFSDLVQDLYSERMLANFFVLTCPYLFVRDTVAYFAVLRDYHSYHAIQPITETTQLLIDVHRYRDKLHVHPLKVDHRYSPTMHLFHIWEGDDFIPITDSGAISDIVSSARWPGLRSASYRMVGMWDRRFMQAEEVLDAHQHGQLSRVTVDLVFERLLTQLLSRDEQILELVRKYLTVEDLIYIWKRVVGSGMIGGKAVGMLLARAILRRAGPRWAKLLEAQDSFFIGSDIFYTYLVHNECWWIRQKQKNADTLFDGIDQARRRILQGSFPDVVTTRFGDMLDYFGQSPIIVRSSSLLEDAFGNAFAGKYDSVFCSNQGTREQRLEEFLAAVRVVYASAMSEGALRYRARRGVLEEDEQMSLLVQRVSGEQHGELFYPQLSGVGFSVNPFVWHPDIDPEAGMVRIVFGLGTRAVDRTDDDYTHVVALNAPHMRPEGSREEILRHSQRRVDYMDLKHHCLASGYFDDVISRSPGLSAELFAQQHQELARQTRSKSAPWVVDLERAFSAVPLLEDMREMLQILRDAYGRHVDIEFTANVQSDGSYKINLLQCRPLQIQQAEVIESRPSDVSWKDLILEAHGAVLGCNRLQSVDRVIYVVPSAYGQLPTQDRYYVAQLVGKLVHLDDSGSDAAIMLLGPGRWGSKMPELGVPVSFAEINTVSALCEIDAMHEGLTPDLSLGTHFFHEMVEMDMLYIGYFQNNSQNLLDQEWLSQAPNHLSELLPDESRWSEVVRVLEAPPGRKLILWADHLEQQALLYLDRAKPQ